MNTPDMPLSAVDVPTLNGAARATSAAVDAALSVVGLAMDADAEGRAVPVHELRPLADAANNAIQRAHRFLLASGARDPDLPTTAAPVPLHLLDTPDSRRLLALLEEAQAAAERVDAERGRALPADTPLLPGESRGTDLAETISEIALRVRVEVQGPKGRE